MNARELIEAFDVLADAPDGVKRLRELVLQLAVRGKLVEQREGDGAATKPVRTRAPAGATSVDPPFHLPVSWIWCRLDEIAAYNGRPNSAPEDIPSGAWLLDLEDIEKSTSRLIKRATAGERASRSNKSSFLAGDVLYGKLRPYLDKVLVAETDGYCTTEIVPVVPGAAVASAWLRLSLKRPDFLVHVNKLSYGVKMPRLGTEDANSTLHPLPPLAEQHRIVARVDELMGLLDRLEAARTARDDVRRAARDAALAALRDAEDTQAVEAAWGRIAGQMDFLFAGPEDVGPIRQAVLSLAVRGRLVPQDRRDEAARTHLHRLNGSTWRSATIDVELPALPPGWEWATAEQLASPDSTITYGVLKPEWVERGVPTVRVRDLQDGVVRVEDVGQCEPARAEKFRKTTLKAGDLLIAKDGATLGKTAFVPPALAGGNITQHVLRFSIRDGLATRYVRLVVDSPHGQGWMLGETRGVALPGVNVGDFRRMPIALPPLAEQHRIVAKVDALMTLCDALEARLTTTRDLQAQFAAASVHHLDV